MSKNSKYTAQGAVQLLKSEALRRNHPVAQLIMSALPLGMAADDGVGIVFDQPLYVIVLWYFVLYIRREGFAGVWNCIKQLLRIVAMAACAVVFADDVTGVGLADNVLNVAIGGGLTAFNLLDLILQKLKVPIIEKINRGRMQEAARFGRSVMLPSLNLTPDQKREIKLAEKATAKQARKTGMQYLPGLAATHKLQEFLESEPSLNIHGYLQEHPEYQYAAYGPSPSYQ